MTANNNPQATYDLGAGKVNGGMAMSLDGFVSDRNGDVSRLYPDMDAMRESDVLQELLRTTGAVMMGRRSYDMGEGDFTGYEFQTPIFVLTHQVPEPVAKGENDQLTFHFVTDGIESAIRQAKAAAGGKNITIVGGADTIQQTINAGLLDELLIDLVPVLLGDGLRLLENLGPEPIELESLGAVESPVATHLRYRIVK